MIEPQRPAAERTQEAQTRVFVVPPAQQARIESFPRSEAKAVELAAAARGRVVATAQHGLLLQIIQHVTQTHGGQGQRKSEQPQAPREPFTSEGATYLREPTLHASTTP